MKSSFEQMGGTYHKDGEYFLPDLIAPECPALGIWGQRRRRFLREHHKPLYTGMLLAGTLDSHLADTDRVADEMFSRLVEQMAESEHVNEELKRSNQMEWAGRMNNIQNRAAEIVKKELIFA